MTRKRLLILHIGLPKTGSTTLQMLLKVNQKGLAPHIATVLRQSGRTKALRRACAAFQLADYRKTPLTKPTHAVRKLAGTLVEHIPDDQRPIVVSEENLPGNMPGATPDFRLFPVLPALAEIFCEVFSAYDLRFHIVTRDYSQWLRSAHNQAIRTDRCTLDWSGFIRAAPTDTDLRATVDALAAAVGSERVIAAEMEKDAGGAAGPGTTVLAAAGVPEPVIVALRRPGASNQSLGAAALEFQRQVNATGISFKALRNVRKLIIQNPALFRDE